MVFLLIARLWSATIRGTIVWSRSPR